MKIGVIKEGKVPADMRVPLTPWQCKEINDKYDDITVVVQSSDIRCFSDDEYRQQGVEVVASIDDCDVLMGVKEVPVSQLIADKTYFYFSHTIKMQPYNKKLLQEMLKLNIKMIDYEVIKNQDGKRLIGFGRYAGVVGCYNSFLAYGKKSGAYQLKPANKCSDRTELNAELKKVTLPKNYKIVLTGLGRVAGGAIEIVEEIGIKKVSPQEFLTQEFNEPVYTQLSVKEYNERLDGADFRRRDFFMDPSGYKSVFMKYAKVSDMYVACHYWDSASPFIFSKEDAKSEDFKIKIVGDISCDIDGPVASTIRPSTIAEPLYGYNPITESETDFMDTNSIGVMAVDNLPCELPKDASEDFGNEFLNHVLPNLVNDKNNIIYNATMTKNGKLTPNFSYLKNYAGISSEDSIVTE